jgi:Zn-dependent protease
VADDRVPAESALERLRRLEAEERAARAPAASPPPQAARRRGVVATIVSALLFALAKGKVLLGALKVGPLLQTFSTLALSAWIYAGYYGAPLAIGLVLLILVHEYGHGLAAKAMGLRVGAPIFIPFFGAVIALKDQPRSTWVDAVVGFGGPAAGTLGGVVVLAAGLAAGAGHAAGLLVAVAWLAFTLNLFNLIPVFGLDGDRISSPFRPWFWIPGGFVVLALAIASIHATGHLDPFLLFVMILGGVKAVRGAQRERRAKAGDAPTSLLERVTHRERYVEESAVERKHRVAAAIAYFGLIVVLVALILWSRSRLPAVAGADR